ncbi:MAG TPA: MFS transporter [Mycobacteriales bacterium]|nr:MFS transporter [Mycobacteriales bacterium]
MSQAAVAPRITVRDVLANREFRAMYAAQALSVVGDQLARIAVALLVFDRSHSALLTAVSFGVSYLPWVVGGPLLAGYADRMPRRTVMIASDLVRVVLVLGIAIPGMPIAALLVLVTLVALMEPPFLAARAAMLPDVIGEGDRYAFAATLSNTTNNLGVVAGFAVGGAVVAAIGARTGIIVDSLTFAFSAWLLARRVKMRPAADAGRRKMLEELRQGAEIVFREPYVRWLVVVSWLILGADISTEAVAVPYAAHHGGGATTAGLITAALPLGMVVGTLALMRWRRPTAQERLMLPMALAAPAVLALTAFDPRPTVAAVIWFVTGALSAMQVVANRVFVAAVPRELRGRAFGIAAAGISSAQGIGAILCGALASRVGSAVGIADIALPVFAAVAVISVRTFTAGGVEPRAADADAFNDPLAWTDDDGDHEEEIEEPSRRAARPRPEPRIWAFTAGLALAVVLAFLPIRDKHALVAVNLPGWWFFALYLIAIAAPLHFVFRRQPWSVHLEAVPLVLGLFFLRPSTLLAVVALAMAFAHGVVRRQPVIRLAFNVSSAALATLAAILVFRAFSPAGSGVHVDAWPAAFGAVAVNEVVSFLSVLVVVGINERSWSWRQTLPGVAFASGVGQVNTFLALSTAAALKYDGATAWAITVFVVLSVTAVRTYHRLADRHAALDKLYAVARELGPIAAEPADMAPALIQLRRIVRAETLELAMVADDPGFAAVISVLDDADGERFDITERELDEQTRELLGSATGVRREAIRRLNPLAQRRARRSDDRMAVPVLGNDRTIAVLSAHQRVGSVGAFDQADFRLLEAAAEQLAAALEKGRLVESLRRAATRDSLTNLANLDSLRSFLATMLDGSAGGVLLLLDIDRFHEINDTLGHDAGDAILVEVSRRLESAPTHGALAARVGGDQFALAIPGQAGGEVARLAALAVKSRVDGPIRFDAVSADLRITIGMARAPEHGNDAATLLRRAEMAMSAAKGTSAGIGEWEPSYERDGSRRLQLLAGLRQALASNELWVEFQPKILLGTGEAAGFEALVRWRHPELGLVSPAEFVPLAEASGLISALTSTVLRRALDACRRWHDMGRPVGVAVNISARSLDDPVLVGQVAAMLTASGVEPRWLTLEITESSVMENAARSIDVLLQLRSLGVRLSIDDFGTGYSSLHQLRGLPVHEVKIDKAFVDEVDGDGADRAVVRAVVELAESLGLTTVAEGVEHAAQAYALDALGVAQVQGYFYGRPMPEPVATEWLLPRSTPLAEQHPET